MNLVIKTKISTRICTKLSICNGCVTVKTCHSYTARYAVSRDLQISCHGIAGFTYRITKCLQNLRKQFFHIDHTITSLSHPRAVMALYSSASVPVVAVSSSAILALPSQVTSNASDREFSVPLPTAKAISFPILT